MKSLDLTKTLTQVNGYPHGLIDVQAVSAVLRAFQQLEREQGKDAAKSVEDLASLCPDHAQEHVERAMGFLLAHNHVRRHEHGFVRRLDVGTDGTKFGKNVAFHPIERPLQTMVELLQRVLVKREPGFTGQALSGQRTSLTMTREQHSALETLARLTMAGQNRSVIARDIRKRIPGSQEERRALVDSLAALGFVTFSGQYPSDYCLLTLRGLLASPQGIRAARWIDAILACLAEKVRKEDNVVRFTWKELKESAPPELSASDDDLNWVVQLVSVAELSRGGGPESGVDKWYWGFPDDVEVLVESKTVDDLLRLRDKTAVREPPKATHGLPTATNKGVPQVRNDVFIVHGKNHEVRDKIDLFLNKELRLATVVMESQPHGGRTLPEKFERAASHCAFAVLIMTGDDRLVTEDGSTVLRARQNVVLEIGYFWGKLGRSHVAVVVDSPEQMELPSDIHGLGYIKITPDLAETKEKLRKELAEAGLL